MVQGNSLYENDEYFLVTLSEAAGASIVRATASGTILNDDVRRRAVGR